MSELNYDELKEVTGGKGTKPEGGTPSWADVCKAAVSPSSYQLYADTKKSVYVYEQGPNNTAVFKFKGTCKEYKCMASISYVIVANDFVSGQQVTVGNGTMQITDNVQ